MVSVNIIICIAPELSEGVFKSVIFNYTTYLCTLSCANVNRGFKGPFVLWPVIPQCVSTVHCNDAPVTRVLVLWCLFIHPVCPGKWCELGKRFQE